MNRDNIYTALCAAVLGSMLAVSSVFCLATGFSLPLGNLSRLLWVWVGTALCWGILFQLPRGGLLFPLVCAFFCGYLGRLGTPIRQSLHLLGRIGEIYNLAYQWGIPVLSGTAENFQYPLIFLGSLTASAVSFWTCRGKGLAMTLACILLPVVPCFVVTDTVPDSLWLLLTMTGVAVIIMTAAVRRKSIPQANRLTAFVFLPILVVLITVLLLFPRSGYVNRAGHIREQLLQWVQTMPDRLAHTVTAISKAPSDEVSLDALGPQTPSSRRVLTVTTSTSGALYLRGRDYDCYTGTSWTSLPGRREVFTASGESHSSVTVQTEQPLDHRYLPYYPSQSVVLLDGMTPNPEGATQYTMESGSLSENSQTSSNGALPQETNYLALPESEDYAAILDTILPDGSASTGAKASAIAAFVRSSAVYDLDTQRMPRDSSDFALWFLEDSHRGYCIHFATATAVLLRAAGIPSRYVTGFLVQTQADKPSIVTEKEAHAWAEYFDPQLGVWLILESTPADTESPPSTSEEPLPSSEPTAPTLAATLPAPHTSAPAPDAVPQAGDSTAFLLPAVFTAAAAVLLTLKGQRSLRLFLRRRKQTRGSGCDQALARWQEAIFLSRLLNQSPEGNLLDLAQKAKFSPHDLSDSELECFDTYLRFCRQQLEQKPLYIRLIHKYLYAAY